MKTLPVVNIFNSSYELWSKRDATFDEIKESGNIHLMIKERLLLKICNHIDAAKYIISKQHDDAFEDFIETQLDTSIEFNNMRGEMPSQTPKSLSDHQIKYQEHNFHMVSSDINHIGKKLSTGQILYHGGFWPEYYGEEFVTNRPFSTSFSPQMALRNAHWRGKSYDADEINLFVLRVTTPKTNVFTYRIKGTDKGHEKEILFAAGARLTLKSKTLIEKNTMVYKVNPQNTLQVLEKEVPSYMLEVDIS